MAKVPIQGHSTELILRSAAQQTKRRVAAVLKPPGARPHLDSPSRCLPRVECTAVGQPQQTPVPSAEPQPPRAPEQPDAVLVVPLQRGPGERGQQ